MMKTKAKIHRNFETFFVFFSLHCDYVLCEHNNNNIKNAHVLLFFPKSERVCLVGKVTCAATRHNVPYPIIEYICVWGALLREKCVCDGGLRAALALPPVCTPSLPHDGKRGVRPLNREKEKKKKKHETYIIS